MKISRRFTKPGQDVYTGVKWEKRTSRISNPDGSVVFEMNDAEVPAQWSQLATDIMVSKYFRKAGVPLADEAGRPVRDAKGNVVTGPEKSARQVIHRLAGCWRWWGETHGYFDSAEDAQAFYDELAYMMLHQMCAPNSPQWFNTGLNFAYGITGPAQGHHYCDPKTGKLLKSDDAYSHPQPHACQPYNAPVSTPQGKVAIGKIVKENLVGLEVFDGRVGNGGVTRVVATKANGRRHVLRVILEGGTCVEATGDHLVYVKTSSGLSGRWVRVDALERGMRLVKVSRPRPAEDRSARRQGRAAAAGSAVPQHLLQDEGVAALKQKETAPAANVVELSVLRVLPLGVQEVFDIQTESGQYLSNDVIVHNCFIQSVNDDLVNEGGIMDLWTREARLFKYGSGTGTNFSKVRGENEPLSGGGKSSGLMSFLKIGDRAAGAIKSGGTTRRAAKMVCLDLDHPDVEMFINWKVREELKVAAMVEGLKVLPKEQQETARRLGLKLDYDFNGEAYYTVSGQNSNNSVRIPNAFFHALEEDGDWHLTYRSNKGKVAKTIKARDLWEQIAYAAWRCADPGVQYDGTVNQWHTCPQSGRINASNPCVTGDTRVLTPGGIWRRIDQMIHLPSRVVTNLDGQAIHVTDGAFPTGTKEVYELRTAGGYRLKLTADHKVWTRHRGWVEAQHLQPHDEVRLPSRPAVYQEVGEPQDAKFFQLLGLFLSGGNAGGAGATELRLEACLPDGTLLDEFSRYVGDHWGERAYADDYVQHAMTDGGGDSPSTLTTAVTNKRLLSRLRAFVRAEPGPRHARRLADEAFTAGLAAQKHLLRALFTADAVFTHNTIELRSDSPGLLEDVQLLLLGFGIQSSIVSPPSDGFSSEDGASATGGLPGRQWTSGSDVPGRRANADGASTHNPPDRSQRGGADAKRHGLRIDPGSLRFFGKHVGLLPDRRLAQLADAISLAIAKPTDQANWDRVASFVPLGRQQVFDLTEPVTHSFVANGLTVHNCSEYMFLDDTACFAPETRISTPSGLRTVEELYLMQERGQAVHVTTDIHGEHDHRRLTAHRPAVVTKVGEREVFRLTLRDGRSIRATADHRFLTDAGNWKRLDELTVGEDRLQIREGGNPVAFASPAAEVERWQLLGWLTGDGVFSQDTVALVFGPQEQATAKAMAERFNALLQEACGSAKAGGSIRPCNLSTQANGVMQISSKAEAFVGYLQERYGMRQGTAVHKDVPAALHRAADDLKVAYLQGLFSADGCIRRNASGTEDEVMLASSSPELLRSVQLMLSDLGVTARITWHHPTGRKNAQGQLHLYNQQARKFLALVGFPCSQAKSARAAQILARPFEGALKNPRPSAVVSVEADGTATVYDITEPVTHSVIAEGIIAHNCNLASLNVLTFFDAEARRFDVEGFKHGVRLWTVVLEISVLMASFPSEEIARLSYKFRTLGLGYANLGAMLMQAGIPYDSDKGRAICAAVTAILTGECYAASADMARELGAFPGYEENKADMLRVMRNHRRAAYDVAGTPAARRTLGDYERLDILPVGIDASQFTDHDPMAPTSLLYAAKECWDRAVKLGERHGYRNAQVSVIAPTGTIGLLMDCDTTGVEPDFALVKFKKLAGGGYFKIANQSLEPALRNLGYQDAEIYEILRYVMGTLSLENAPHVNRDSLKALGFTDADLDKVESALPGTFELSFAFSPWAIGAETMKRLGVDEAESQRPGFNLLRHLGFTRRQIDEANDAVCGRGTVEGAPHLKDEHLPVFDCANKCGRHGRRFIPVEGHIRMMAAAQPFISGAISKTINLPHEATVEDIKRSYLMSWELGLKANALYRDGSKLSQPLNVKSDEDLEDKTDEEDADAVEAAREEVASDVAMLATAATTLPGTPIKGDNLSAAPLHTIEKIVERIVERPLRRRLPDTRRAITHKFDVGGHEGYITTGLYEDGRPGEVFIRISKEGSTIGGLMDTVATLVSLALQYGVPVESLVRKFEHVRFEPSGMTHNPDIPFAKSLVDYIFRYLAMEFVPGYRAANAPKRAEKKPVASSQKPVEQKAAAHASPLPEGEGQGEGEGSLTFPRPQPKKKSGNGHGHRVEPDTAQPFDYGTEADEQAALLKHAHPPHHDAPDADPGTTPDGLTLRLAIVSDPLSQQGSELQADAPACDVCGSITVRSGTCYKCLNCGNSMGCS